MITLIIFWNIKWKCSLCSVIFKYQLPLCSCCDNHFIFTRAKHQHMVHSVKVSLEMIKEDYFHQSELENEWYVLLRWTIEPKQTISYSEVSPHTSAQLIIAFSFCCDLAPSHHYAYFDQFQWWTLRQSVAKHRPHTL